MANDLKERCEICRFFEKGAGANGTKPNECRKYAPRPSQGLKIEHFRYNTRGWPIVGKGDWCGQYEARQALEEE